MDSIVTIELIKKKIHLIRGQKVMIDNDLAELYGVPAKVLNQAVKRNIKRFPSDFMFQLNEDEYASLRSQFVTLKKGRGQHRKYPPFAFTEQGVAMLSSVLNSDKAIEMNILLVSPITIALPQSNPVRNKISPNSNKQCRSDEPNKVLIKCTYCISSVRSDRMKRHMKKVHGEPSSTSKKRIPQSTSKRINFSSEHDDYTQKKIEGSTGFHIFRDHGEFGSFPSFDSMDDESSP